MPVAFVTPFGSPTPGATPLMFSFVPTPLTLLRWVIPIPRPVPTCEFRVGPIPLSAECCGDVEVTEDDETVDRDEYETVDAGGEFSGRGIESGSTFAITGNVLVETVPGLLFVFKCRVCRGLPLAFVTDNAPKGESFGLKLAEGRPTLGRTGLGAWMATSSLPLPQCGENLLTMSLLAMLGTRRCRDNGDNERGGGLEDVEAGVGVTEVDGGPKRSPFWEVDGTLGLPTAGSFAFGGIDRGESCDIGDIDSRFSMLR